MVETGTGKHQRTRLLALVAGGPAPITGTHSARRYDVSSGDTQWFQDNIPCQAACPAHTDVPRYIALLAEGSFTESYALNREHNVLPGCLGRVCARPCEDACRRGRIDAPVAICSLKRLAADRRSPAFEPAVSVTPRGARVSIIGAGPAGLSAARELARLGYRVTIYEQHSVPGGMLWAGIPEWRLPRHVVADEVEAITRLGVEIRCNERIGDRLTLDMLVAESDAVLIATGCQATVGLGIPGEDLHGVVSGLRYLEGINLGQHADTREEQSYRTVTIGGGYTSLDCARSALRARVGVGVDIPRSILAYRRELQDIPASQDELHEAAEEGVEFQFLVTPVRILGAEGRVSGVEFVRNQVSGLDSRGKRRIAPIPDSDFIIPCEQVIVAIGQAQDNSFLQPGLIPDIDARGVPTIDDEFRTAHPNVWAAGDYVANPRNIISAVADGLRAAASIDRALSPGRLPRSQPSLHGELLDITHLEGSRAPRLVAGAPADWSLSTLYRRLRQDDDYLTITRQPLPMLPVSRRGLGQRIEPSPEVEQGFGLEIGQEQARRCLQCQLNIFIDGAACILCGACVEVCPEQCIAMVPLEALNSIDGDTATAARVYAQSDGTGAAMLLHEDNCVRCGRCVDRCPTGCLTMEHFSLVEALAAV